MNNKIQNKILSNGATIIKVDHTKNLESYFLNELEKFRLCILPKLTKGQPYCLPLVNKKALVLLSENNGYIVFTVQASYPDLFIQNMLLS